MINLDAYIERTVDFKLNGELVKVKEPSNALFKKIALHESREGDEIFTSQLALVTEVLNRNTTGHTFTQGQVSELPQSALNVILQNATALARKGIEDPN